MLTLVNKSCALRQPASQNSLYRPTRKLRLWTLCVGLCVNASVNTSMVHAGAEPGISARRKPQGPELRAVQLDLLPTLDGSAWLQGDRLAMVRTDERTGVAQVIDVIGLSGARVRATIWTAGRGWQVRTIDGAALVGGQWHETRCVAADDCRRVRYRIVAADRDTSMNTTADAPGNDDVWLYRVHYAEITEADTGASVTWRPVCASTRPARTRLDRTTLDRDRRGLFVAGRWRRDGSYDPDGYTFSCLTGVIAKCVRDFGYKPWDRRVGAHGQLVAMRPLHLACVRAARADYCGDGQPHTRAGTLVAMVDGHGFNPRRSTPGLAREAEFDADGAVIMVRPRWPLNSPLACAARLPRGPRPGAGIADGDRAGRVAVYSQVRE